MAICMKYINEFQNKEQMRPLTPINENNGRNYNNGTHNSTSNGFNLGNIVHRSDSEVIYEDGEYRAYISGNQNPQQIHQLKL